MGAPRWFRSARRAEEVPALKTRRRMAQGEVVGFEADNGAFVWRGIPFAASTAGANRWRAPQAPPIWQGVRDALDFTPRCAQLTNEFDKDEGLPPGIVVGSEDCLALDIYAPPDTDDEPLPVMVWIHPGGNVWGRSSKYDGSRLARNEHVVVVAVQYRVGLLGWFAHEALRETAKTSEDASACFATLDLLTAAGHEAVYAYRFDWDDGGRILFMDFRKVLGAAHGFEIPFVFNRFVHLGDADRILFGNRTRDDRGRLSRAMGAYWASFAVAVCLRPSMRPGGRSTGRKVPVYGSMRTRMEALR